MPAYWKRFIELLSTTRTIWFFVGSVIVLLGWGTFFANHRVASAVFVIGGVGVLALGALLAPSVEFKILDLRPDVTSDPAITYKSKLRIVLRNNTKKQLKLGYLRWGYGPKEAPSDPAWYIFQPKDPAGFWESGHWGPEAKTIVVEPQGIFRVSVALPPGTTDAAIRSAHARNELGVLHLIPNGSDQPNLKDIRF